MELFCFGRAKHFTVIRMQNQPAWNSSLANVNPLTSKECVNLHYLETCLFVHTFRFNVIAIIRKRSNQVSVLQKKICKQPWKAKTHINEKHTPYHSQLNLHN